MIKGCCKYLLVDLCKQNLTHHLCQPYNCLQHTHLKIVQMFITMCEVLQLIFKNLYMFPPWVWSMDSTKALKPFYIISTKFWWAIIFYLQILAMLICWPCPVIDHVEYSNGIETSTSTQIPLFALGGQNPLNCTLGFHWTCCKGVIVAFSIFSLSTLTFLIVGIFILAFFVIHLYVLALSIDAIVTSSRVIGLWGTRSSCCKSF